MGDILLPTELMRLSWAPLFLCHFWRIVIYPSVIRNRANLLYLKGLPHWIQWYLRKSQLSHLHKDAFAHKPEAVIYRNRLPSQIFRTLLLFCLGFHSSLLIYFFHIYFADSVLYALDAGSFSRTHQCFSKLPPINPPLLSHSLPFPPILSLSLPSLPFLLSLLSATHMLHCNTFP